jgi:hypothetical protein
VAVLTRASVRRRPAWRATAALAALGVVLCGAGDSELSRRAIPPPGPSLGRLPKEVLFVDDFSEGIGRWSSDQDGIWAPRLGALRADMPDGRQQRSFAYAGEEEWRNYAVDLDVCQMRGVDKGVVVRVLGDTGVGVDLRGPGYHDLVVYRREFPLGKARVQNGNGMWHHLRVECRGGELRVLVNGDLVLERGDRRRPGTRGRIALPAYTGGGGECTVYYDNVVVTPL